MEHSKILLDYYDKLAGDYDENRFGNTYGRYIHQQEVNILAKILPATATNNILDLGCGTGRLMPFANYGLDISPTMIEVAQNKFPNKQFAVGNAAQNDLKSEFFDTIFSFHVLMHQKHSETSAILGEAHRLLKKGGQFIFDFPSDKRRKLVNYKAQNWHAANQLSLQQIKGLAKTNQWDFKQSYGLLFLPIHRIPQQFRSFLIPMDNFLCRSFLQEYASYLIVILTKK